MFARAAAGRTEDSLPLRKALRWVAANRAPGGGIRVNHKSRLASREVTGYLIDSLYRAGEENFAFELARWEAAGQQPDGSVAAPDGVPYTFDTAQVIRGFLAVLDDLPEIEPHLKRACDWVAGQVQPDGCVTSPSLEMWSLPDGTRFTEYANLYVLPPLRAAGERLGDARYRDAARRGMEYFRRKPDLVEFKPQLGTLSHIFGYMMEALVELGEYELARKGLSQAASIQRPDGSIPAFPGAEWVCSTGVAQLAIAWYRMGENGPAHRAVAYLEGLQNASGGFFGSYGPGANYLPDVEISWGVKFFMDALLLREEANAAVGLTEPSAGSLPSF
jgi:malonyl-CoA O-methyltransferase